MAPAPWDSLPGAESLFVMVTGANSGVGFGICQRLIDEYLTTHSLTSHLILLPTARSVQKSQQTIDALRKHAKHFAETSEALRARAGPAYNPRDATRRVHIAGVQLDLCNLPSIYKAADQLVSGTVSSPSADGDFISLENVKINRLDAVVFNAGNGGFTGLNWSKVVHNFVTSGFVQAVTWPTFKSATRGDTIDPIATSSNNKNEQNRPRLGEIFCSNVFGHYLLGHELLPLLNRPTNSDLPPARLVWESSLEPQWHNLDLDDFQSIKTDAAYESTKRLTDVLALTAHLPSTQPYRESYLGTGRATRRSPAVKLPRLYLVHPGIVHSPLFPLNAFLFFWYRIALYLARWLGSPWHTVEAYKGAVAPVWIVLQSQEALDANKAEQVKWGSSTTWGGEARVKKTEVEGWGWDGQVEDWKAMQAAKEGMLGKRVGRKHGAVDLTAERRVDFEELGATCWKEMERLRAEWEPRVKGTATVKEQLIKEAA